MRVVYSSDLLGVHDYRFLEMLLNNGHQVTLITYVDQMDRPEYVASGFDVRNLSGLNIVRHAGYARNSSVSPFIRFRHFKKVVHQLKPDIVHTCWLQTSGLVGALAGYHPLVAMPLGSDALMDPDRFLKLRLITHYVVRQADALLVNSEAVRRKLIELTGCPSEKIRKVYFGVDIKRFAGRFDREALKRRRGWQGKIVLVHNRRFRPVYGHKYLFQAMKNLVKTFPNLILILGHSGPIEEELRQLATRLGIQKHLFWPGCVPLEEFIELVRCGDIFVNPSLSDSSSAALLEAMACGLPLVATRVGGTPEWIKNGVNGLLVSPADSVGLEQAIRTLIENEKMRSAMGEENIPVAMDRADREKNFREIEKLYDELASEKGTGHRRRWFHRKSSH